MVPLARRVPAVHRTSFLADQAHLGPHKTVAAMDSTFSGSVLGFRPFTLRFPDDSAITFKPNSITTATTTTPRPPIRTQPLGNPHLVSEDTPSTSVLTVVLPVLFGSLFLLGVAIGLVGWLSHRSRTKKASAKLQKKRRIVAEPQSAAAAQWGSRRRETAELELDDFDRQTLNSLMVADDVARARYAASFKTHDLPRKPPPAYEP